MTKDSASLITEVPLFLRNENLEMVAVGECYFDTEDREVRVQLREGNFSPRELTHLAHQAMSACERLLEGK